jgi:hypothetical protein
LGKMLDTGYFHWLVHKYSFRRVNRRASAEFNAAN